MRFGRRKRQDKEETVCAWHATEEEKAQVKSHGICPDCLAQAFPGKSRAEIEAELTKERKR